MRNERKMHLWGIIIHIENCLVLLLFFVCTNIFPIIRKKTNKRKSFPQKFVFLYLFHSYNVHFPLTTPIKHIISRIKVDKFYQYFYTKLFTLFFYESVCVTHTNTSDKTGLVWGDSDIRGFASYRHHKSCYFIFTLISVL